MTNGFDSSGTDLVTLGGVVKLSTAKPQFNRVPMAAILLSSTTITFPDLDKGYDYFYATYAGTHGTAEQCIVGQKFIGQEWGPSALGFTSPHLLPDVDLGPVPAGCDYLDVQVNLTRTTGPTDANFANPYMLFYGWPIEIQQGQWLQLTDAALVVEHEVGFSRMFWFEIVAGRILFRRKQSVVSVDSAGAIVPNDGIIGFPYGFVQQAAGNVLGKVNDPGTNSLGPAHANGTGCSTVASLNATSIYSGQIKIVPCCTV